MNASRLSQKEIQQIHHWASEGDQLADIQKKLESELGYAATYLDTRMLVLDLAVEILSPEQEKKEEPQKERVATGEVNMTLDELVRPGMMVSGRVTFSDGEPALWGLDQMGRLDLDAETPGYQPSEEDAASFQDQLRAKLEEMRGQSMGGI